MPTKKKPIDAGPKATQEQARRAFTEADALLRRLDPLNVSGAAESMRADPPSWEAVAVLAEYAMRVWKHQMGSKGGRASKTDLTIEQVRASKAKFEALYPGKTRWKAFVILDLETTRKTLNRILDTNRLGSG